MRILAIMGLLLGLTFPPGVAHCDEPGKQEGGDASVPKKLVFSEAQQYGSPAFVCDFFIHAFHLSPKGKYAALLERPSPPVRKTRLDVWDVPGAKRVTTLELEGTPRTLAFSSDERLLAVYDTNGPISVYTTTDWWISSRITTNARDYDHLAISTDGKSLLLANSQGSLQLIDIATKKIRTGFEVDLRRTQLCGFLPAGRLWALGVNAEGSATLKVVDIDKKTTETTQIYHNDVTAAIGLDGRSLVVATDDRIRRIDLDRPTLGKWSEVLWPEYEGIRSVSVLADNKRAVLSTPRRLAVVDIDAARMESNVKGYSDVGQMQSTGGAPWVAFADHNRLRILDAQRGMVTINPGHGVPVTDLVQDPATRIVFSTDTVSLYASSRPGSPPAAIHFSGSGSTRLGPAAPRTMVLHSGTLYVAPMANNTWRTVDTKSLMPTILHKGPLGNTDDVAICKQERRELFWTCAQGVFLAIDLTTGKEMYRVGKRVSSVTCALSPAGETGLVLAGDNLTIHSLPSGEVTFRSTLTEVLSPAAPKLLRGDRYAVAAVLRLGSPDELAAHPAASRGINSGIGIGSIPGDKLELVGFSREPIVTYELSGDARLIAVSRGDGNVEVWQVAPPREIASGRLPEGCATAFAWDEHSRVLYVGTSHGTVYLIETSL